MGEKRIEIHSNRTVTFLLSSKGKRENPKTPTGASFETLESFGTGCSRRSNTAVCLTQRQALAGYASLRIQRLRHADAAQTGKVTAWGSQVSFLKSAAIWSGLSKLVLIWVSTSTFSTTSFCGGGRSLMSANARPRARQQNISEYRKPAALPSMHCD